MSKKNSREFIALVKSYPMLYDMSNPDYKNLFLKNTIWNEIGEQLNMSVDDVKSRWKNLRDSYSKYLKGTIKPSTGNISQSYSRYCKWQWASAMEFLKDHTPLSLFDTHTAIENEDEREPSTQDIIEHKRNNDNKRNNTDSFPVPSASNQSTSHLQLKKRTFDKNHSVKKRIVYSNSKPDKYSSTEHIMLGYAKAMDGFSERRKIITKMKIAQIIMEAELEEEQERNQQQVGMEELQFIQTEHSCTELNLSREDRCTSQDSCCSQKSNDDPLSQPDQKDIDIKSEIIEIQIT